VIVLVAILATLDGCIKQRHAIVNPPPPEHPDSTVILAPK